MKKRWQTVAAGLLVCVVGVAPASALSGFGLSHGDHARAHASIAGELQRRVPDGALRLARGASSTRRTQSSARATLARARASQLAFHHLASAASERLAKDTFGSWLAAMSTNPASSLATAGSVLRYLGANRALVRTARGLQLDTSTVPLLAGRTATSTRPVSLALRATASGFAAANPLQDTSVARTLAGGVAIGSAGIRIVPLGADVSGGVLEGKTVFFPEVGLDEDALVTPTIRGVDLAALLRSRLSPQQLAYRVLLPAGAALSPDGGGALVTRDGRTLALVRAPAARDALGAAVPATMTVTGDELVVSVAHTSSTLAYPIMVDPEVLTITESAEHWQFFGEGEGTPPGGGAPVTLHNSGTFPPHECGPPPEETCGSFRSSGGWEWIVGAPFSPATSNTDLTVEFDDVNFSSSASGETSGVSESPRDATWGLFANCGKRAGGGVGGNREQLPTSDEAFTASECQPNYERAIGLSLEVGQNHLFRFGTRRDEVPPVTVSASLSVGAILAVESLPVAEEPGSELYGIANQGEPARADCLYGATVNCASGNETLSQTDLEVGGRGPGLHLERTYNSQLAAAQARSGSAAGPFGFGWTSSYSAHLELGAGTAIVHQDNGSTVTFLENNEGAYVPTSPLVQSTLARNGSQYVYTLPDQTKLVFGDTGLLLSETDRNGNAITLTYEEVPCEESIADARRQDRLAQPASTRRSSCPSPPEERVATITDPAGRSLHFAYNEKGFVESVTGPMGHIVHYEYLKQNLVAVQEPGATSPTWRFSYDSSHELTASTDAKGNTTSSEYDEQHRVTSQTDPAGRKRTWSYNGSEVVIGEPTGSNTTVSLNGAGLETSVTSASGTSSAATTTYEYDTNDNLLSVTNPQEQKTSFTYDAAGDRLSASTPMGHVTKWAFNSTHDLTSTTTPAGETTTLTLDSHGDVVEASSPAPGGAETTKYSYNANGEPTSMTDPLGHTWTYEYDSYGDRTSETDPEGHKRTFAYDEDSEEISSTTALGNKTTIERDAQGQPVTVTEPPTHTGESTRHLEFLDAFGTKGKAAGQLVSPQGIAIDAQGNIWVADTKNNRIEELTNEGKYLQQLGSKGAGAGQLSAPAGIAIDAQGNIWVADTKNNRIEEFSSAGKYLQQLGTSGSGAGQMSGPHALAIDTKGDVWVADTANNRVQEWVTGSTKYVYAANGELEAVIDPDGHATTYTYNAAGEPTKITHTGGATEEIGYNAAGQVTTQTDGNAHTTTYVRNALGAVTETTEQLGHKTLMTYTKTGQLETTTDPEGHAATYSYNADGQVTKITYSDGRTPTVEYTYDADGAPATLTDGSGTTTFTYDQLDRLTETKDGAGDTVGYEYNAAGEPTKITYPNGKAVERGYDPVGRLASVTDWLGNTTRFSYDADSSLTSTAFPAATGETDSYAYTPSQQISATTFARGSETLASLSYTRNNDGQVISTKAKGLPGEETTGYAYDDRNRLVQAGSTAYEYDGAGNPVKLGTGTNTFNAGDELTAGAGTSYGYNEDADRVSSHPPSAAATSYTYNQIGELTSVSRPAEGSTPKLEDSYVYNGEGLRVSQTDATATTNLAWDLAESPATVLSDGGASYVYGPEDLPIEQISSSEAVLYLHHDQQGSTRLLTETDGNVAGSASYNAYGVPAALTGATSPLGFDGQYTDADTGLQYLRSRYYDPATAQFLTRDPEAATTQMPYAFAKDDPIDNADATGADTEGLCVGASASIFHVHVGLGGCAVRAREKGYEEEQGTTSTVAGGASTGFDASANLSAQVSNLRRVGGLAGAFHFASVEGQFDVGVAGTVFWSFSANPLWYGVEFGASLGEGAAVTSGVSYTKTHKQTGLVGFAIEVGLEVAYHEEPTANLLKRALRLIRQHR